LVNEQELLPELAVSRYDALTREVEAEALRRRERAKKIS
jgi:hypothetical protein